MLRFKLWNTSLHNVSKKRKDAIESGKVAPKRRKPLKYMSAKQKKRIMDYRTQAFARWGVKCFLCGKAGPEREFDIHHIDGRANGDNVERMVPLCNRFCGCGAHNHNGKDARFYELRDQIEWKMKMLVVKDKKNSCK